MDNFQGASQNIESTEIDKLAGLFPAAVAEGKIDFEKLKAILGGQVELGERYGLSWKGKSDIFRSIQEPTTKTLKPIRGESVDFDATENLFIEGDNLEVLKVLQRSYYGKVKMIYIDPPYNTGNDFVYNDTFAQSRFDYDKDAGIRDEQGNIRRTDPLQPNRKDGGHYHSNWLNMMYPRLYLARNLLRQDGVIFVSIDDNEVHNLKMIMNEIFGEENFIADIIWEKRYTRNNDAKLSASLVEHILHYRKSDALKELREGRTEKANSIYNNIDNDTRGAWTSVSYVSQRTKSQRPNLSYEILNPINGAKIIHPTSAWKFSKDQYQKHLDNNELYWGRAGENTYPRLKKFLSDVEGKGMVPVNLWNYKDTGTVDIGAKEVDELLGKDIFDYPKPTSLIMRMLVMCTQDDDIVLDFFAGSGSTADAVIRQNAQDGANRKWVCVQLPEITNEDSGAYKAGYKNIADLSKERIRRAGKRFENDNQLIIDLGFKLLKLESTNFNIWNSDIKDADQLRQQMLDIFDPIRSDASEEDLLTELILKNGIELTAAHEQKNAGHGQYWLIAGDLVICLEKEMSTDLFANLLAEKPKTIIVLESSMCGNDQLKANLTLQAERAGVKAFVI
ncbi:site-specific DNA-methyltransferase [soil metagenome]